MGSRAPNMTRWSLMGCWKAWSHISATQIRSRQRRSSCTWCRRGPERIYIWSLSVVEAEAGAETINRQMSLPDVHSNTITYLP